MASVENIYIDQGSDYSAVITVSGPNGLPIVLTGFTIEAQIRKYYGSSTAYCFKVEIVDEQTGKIRIALPSDVSQSMRYGRYVYDVRIISPENKKYRVVEGQLILTPQSTEGSCTP